MGSVKKLSLNTSAELFAALGDNTRLTLVSRLSTRGPLSITELSEGLDVTRQAVSKHLKVMEEAGLVSGIKKGREQIWELEQKRLQVAQDFLLMMANRWDDAIDRLRSLVEE